MTKSRHSGNILSWTLKVKRRALNVAAHANSIRQTARRRPACSFVIPSEVEESVDIGSAHKPIKIRDVSTTLDMTDKKPMRILSGIQPSGVLHIGNYFGMMKPAVALQGEDEAFYFIADFHALTTLRDPEALRENSRRVALDFLACGLDPSRATLFRHSDVPQVTELAWILSTVAPMGLLERAHSYKDKLARGLPATVGLFNYPVLMAADILIYDSDVVPVGKDQKQHIEITRDLAVKMNETFGEIFKLPEARIQPATETVPGIDGQKMSKSYGNNIDIFGDEKEVRKRVMSIVTDSTPVEEPKDLTQSTILKLYSLVASKDEIATMRENFLKGGTGYGDFKKQLFEKLWEYFAPMRKRREEILADQSYIDNILETGAARANEIAGQVMKRVREAVGLR
jgi:tryptophanyl-tRNA synthetase